MVKKRYLAVALLPVLAMIFASAGVASAHGGFGFGRFAGNASPDEVVERHQAMFTAEAALFGITVDQMKQYWAEGKSFKEIADAHGITQDQLRQRMQAAHEAQVKAQLATLVTRGVLTQAQADKRFATMQTRAGAGGAAFGKKGMMPRR